MPAAVESLLRDVDYDALRIVGCGSSHRWGAAYDVNTAWARSCWGGVKVAMDGGRTQLPDEQIHRTSVANKGTREHDRAIYVCHGSARSPNLDPAGYCEVGLLVGIGRGAGTVDSTVRGIGPCEADSDMRRRHGMGAAWARSR